jgi:hypothetical protein
MEKTMADEKVVEQKLFNKKAWLAAKIAAAEASKKK